MAGATLQPLLITPGEPAGIGPELACRVAALDPSLIVVADPDLLRQTAEALGLDTPVLELEGIGADATGGIRCLPVALEAPVRPGRPDPANASYVLESLKIAAGHCLAGRVHALVTGPVHKGTINEAGIAFSGHTEFLAEQAAVERVVMMLAAGKVRVALATTHLPLRAVPDAITASGLRATLQILDGALRQQFGLRKPKIAVLGLNPHAGEGGYLGREELEVIEPVMEALRASIDLVGPLPADTAFVPNRVREFDAVLAMYHDQGLPVLKHIGFGHAVNVTLGLPFIRTSVDHGTAFDLAGRGKADTGSLIAALNLARSMNRPRG